jgi:predicted amidohydrolase
MRIAAAQISCVLGDVGANTAKIREFSIRAKEAGVELIVFPEAADTGYSMSVAEANATNWAVGVVPELQKIAKQLSLVIVSGVSERDSSVIYNSQVVIDPRGQIIARYRKSHLFAMPPIDERSCFSPGSELSSFSVGELRCGLSICYDLRFPELYRCLALKDKVNVFVMSSAWPLPRAEHLRTLAMARAIENQSYVVLANRVGTDDGAAFCGNSAIIDPYGIILAAASAEREELIHADISKEGIALVRSRMPVFADRRQDLYQRYSS